MRSAEPESAYARGSLTNSLHDSENEEPFNRGNLLSAMTDSSMPRSRDESFTALSDSSVNSLSNSLRSAQSEFRGREYFTKSREECIDMPKAQNQDADMKCSGCERIL